MTRPAKPTVSVHTMPLRSVLCATDLSDGAVVVLGRAAQLAHEHQAELHAVHVVGGTSMDALRQWLGAASTAELALLGQAQGELQRAMALAVSDRKVRVHAIVLAGSVADQVIAAAHRVDAELLVVGARPSTNPLRRVALGSTADRLLRRGHRPVLVARGVAQKWPTGESGERVLVAVDFSAWSAASLAWARTVAPHAHIVLHHAWSVPFEEKLRFAGVERATVHSYENTAYAHALSRLHALASAHGLGPNAWTPSLVRGDATLTTAQAALDADCHLIVVGKHGLHATQDLLLGSVTRYVLGESDLDVLVVPTEASPASTPLPRSPDTPHGLAG
ncbi:universal stress protein [Paracidovorax sp. MALMAid1276]|uniref:universal stress protein n=1 Tax=Paracidovorax sp. MALMAid1276 TaxID=3411631 RepID=UPI003B9A3969